MEVGSFADFKGNVDRMEKILSWKFIGKESMTGLPEYRNGSSQLHIPTCFV